MEILAPSNVVLAAVEKILCARLPFLQCVCGYIYSLHAVLIF